MEGKQFCFFSVMKKFNLFKTFSAKSQERINVYTDFKGFFPMLKRRFWNLSNLNLVFTLCNFPLFFFLYGISGLSDTKIMAVANPLFPAFHGMKTISQSPEILGQAPFVSQFVESGVASTVTKVFLYLSLLTIVTFALSNAGMAHVVRSCNRGDPIFLWGDFFSTIKRNFRQTLIIGILDVVICVALVWDIIFWGAQGGFVYGLFYYFSIFLGVIYFMMRFYLYTIMITFKLSVYKIFKDAFLLAFLGFKRNIVAFFGIIAVVFLNMYITYIFMPLGIMLPFIITIALCYFIGGYASYPVIKKYMIDPYYDEVDEESSDSGEEPIFEDRG